MPPLLSLPSGPTSVDWSAGWPDAPPAPLPGPCRFCGDPAPVEPAACGFGAEPGAAACLVCRMTGGGPGWNRPSAAQELAVAWLPALPQGGINALVLAIHRAFRDHGEAPALAARPSAGNDTPRLRAAWRAYGALAEAIAEAERLVGTSDPRELGAALLDPAFRGRPAPPVLAGLRVLHKGRHFRGGRDVYPALLDTASGKPAEAA